MISAIAGFVGSMFSSSKLQETAIDGLRKLGGLDEMSGQDKAKYILEYMSVTKHQSPMRRFIAFALTAVYCLCVVVWLGSAVCGYGFSVDACAMLAVNLKIFFAEVVLTPFNLILSFYYVVHLSGKVGGK